MIDRDTDVIGGTTMTVDVGLQPTVSASYVRAVVEFAESRRVPRRTLLWQAGLSEADLRRDDARLPVDCLITTLRAAAHATGDASFAMQFGAHVPCDQVSLAASLGQSATTVPGALEQLNRYARLGIDFPALGSSARFQFDTGPAGTWLTDLRPADAWPEITELVFVRMAIGLRRKAGHAVLRGVHVRHPAPPHLDAYESLFGVPVTFGSARNALLIDPAFLATPLTPAPVIVSRILEAEADARLKALDEQRSCRGRVESVLRAILHTGDVSVERVASALAMSRQTLYRKLKAEGVTYADVLDGIRRSTAVERLSSGAASVREVSALVGFSEPAAFSRAFKRWTGRSPGEVARAR